MQFMLLVYTDDSLLDALPDGESDAMMRGCRRQTRGCTFTSIRSPLKMKRSSCSRRGSRVRASCLALACIVGVSTIARAQSAASIDRFVGAWQGVLPVGAVSLRLALTVQRDSIAGIAGSLTSLDQGNAVIPATLTVRGDSLVVAMPGVGASFTGGMNTRGDTLRGPFVQNGTVMTLTLRRGSALRSGRPQDPKPPFPYSSTEVSVASARDVRLACTLTVPDGHGPFPGAVLVTGSGPQDRDEALMGHRPFLVLADHLTRRGIAVIRCDDRGVAMSTGSFALSTTADFATDAEASVQFLRTRTEIARDRVGLIGHSEGGAIAPMVAARTSAVAFVVMLAGPGVRGDSLLVLQSRAIQTLSGAPEREIEQATGLNQRLYAAVMGARDSADADARVTRVVSEFVSGLPTGQQASARASLIGAVAQLMSPWARYFLRYDPRPSLRRVTVPVLALNGTLDVQVPYRENLDAISAALQEGGNHDVEMVAVPGANHLFQTASTGSVNEYASIEETMSPAVLDRIAGWIVKRFGR